jgi:hypothetical protein
MWLCVKPIPPSQNSSLVLRPVVHSLARPIVSRNEIAPDQMSFPCTDSLILGAGDTCIWALYQKFPSACEVVEHRWMESKSYQETSLPVPHWDMTWKFIRINATYAVIDKLHALITMKKFDRF